MYSFWVNIRICNSTSHCNRCKKAHVSEVWITLLQSGKNSILTDKWWDNMIHITHCRDYFHYVSLCFPSFIPSSLHLFLSLFWSPFIPPFILSFSHCPSLPRHQPSRVRLLISGRTHPLLVTSALLTQTAVNLSCRRHTSRRPHRSKPHSASETAKHITLG